MFLFVWRDDSFSCSFFKLNHLNSFTPPLGVMFPDLSSFTLFTSRIYPAAPLIFCSAVPQTGHHASTGDQACGWLHMSCRLRPVHAPNITFSFFTTVQYHWLAFVWVHSSTSPISISSYLATVDTLYVQQWFLPVQNLHSSLLNFTLLCQLISSAYQVLNPVFQWSCSSTYICHLQV